MAEILILAWKENEWLASPTLVPKEPLAADGDAPKRGGSRRRPLKRQARTARRSGHKYLKHRYFLSGGGSYSVEGDPGWEGPGVLTEGKTASAFLRVMLSHLTATVVLWPRASPAALSDGGRRSVPKHWCESVPLPHSLSSGPVDPRCPDGVHGQKFLQPHVWCRPCDSNRGALASWSPGVRQKAGAGVSPGMCFFSVVQASPVVTGLLWSYGAQGCRPGTGREDRISSTVLILAPLTGTVPERWTGGTQVL